MYKKKKKFDKITNRCQTLIDNDTLFTNSMIKLWNQHGIPCILYMFCTTTKNKSEPTHKCVTGSS